MVFDRVDLSFKFTRNPLTHFVDFILRFPKPQNELRSLTPDLTPVNSKTRSCASTARSKPPRRSISLSGCKPKRRFCPLTAAASLHRPAQPPPWLPIWYPQTPRLEDGVSHCQVQISANGLAQSGRSSEAKIMHTGSGPEPLLN